MNILFITQLYPLSKKSNNSFALHYFVKEWSKIHNVQVIRPWLLMEEEKLPKENKVTVDAIKVNVLKLDRIPVLKICLIKKSKIIKLVVNKPDVIICHLYNSYLTFNFLKDYFNVPFVIGIHGSDVKLAKNIFYRNRIKNALKMADAIAYRSFAIKQIFEDYIQIKGKKTLIAHSGVPLNLIENAKQLLTKKEYKKRETLKIISVCRLIKLKQIDKVIIALNRLKKEGVKWSYTIIGEGPEKQKLKKLASDYDLKKQIDFIDQISREEVFNYMLKHDVFIMPSYNETFGLVFLEAMANGCIVIGAKGWGIDGIVKDGEDGFLCDPYNQEEIYLTLRKVVTTSDTQLNKIRKQSLKRVVNMSDNKIAMQYINDIIKLV